jgi:hypothetical protein
MNDRVPPLIQPFEIALPGDRSHVNAMHLLPQVKVEPFEIRANTARLRISSVELTAAHQF